MSSRTNRVTILAVSKLLNYAVQFLTPILLVRILDREAYGQYKEFFVYTALISSFINFSIKYNLLYFVAKNPKGEKNYIYHTILLLLFTSIIGLAVVYLAKGYFLEITTYNFVIPLIIYLFFFLNLDFIDSYWLAIKKSKYVFYYSFIRAAVRVIVVVITAYITKDVLIIIYLLIFLELIKFIYTFIYLLIKKLLVFKIQWELLKEQLIYIVPLGVASILLEISTDISKVIISSSLGAGALALYAVASQNLPIVNVVRSSVADVIFPDMAQNISADPLESLKLWSKSNIIYLFLMSPLFFILFLYADVFIKVLFTSNYLAAVPIFQIYLFYFLKQCFEMGIPIRVMNQNKYFLIGYIFATGLNIGLLYLLFKILGMPGPAIAYVVSEIILAFYYGKIILHIYKIKVKELFFWRKVFIILGTGLILCPVLIFGRFLPINFIVSALIFSSLYLILYIFILRYFNFEEVDLIMGKIFRRIKLSWK